jgi:putrescine transport system permease protein
VTRFLTLLFSWSWLLILSIVPLSIILAIALAVPTDTVPPFHFAADVGNFAAAATDPLYRRPLWLSLRTAAVSTALCLLIGYPMALGVARAAERWRGPLLLALMLPFWTGFLMRINAWIGMLRDDGWINAALTFFGFAPARLLYTDTALYIGMVYTYLPFMVLPVYARLAKLDPALLEAAADLGASPFRAFLRVTLPLSLPGIAAGVALVFIPCVGEYVIPELLGGPGARAVGRVLSEPRLADGGRAGMAAAGRAGGGADWHKGGHSGGATRLKHDRSYPSSRASAPAISSVCRARRRNASASPISGRGGNAVRPSASARIALTIQSRQARNAPGGIESRKPGSSCMADKRPA